jgi:Ni/Fe-hydrogenase subunit HybB-like protein
MTTDKNTIFRNGYVFWAALVGAIVTSGFVLSQTMTIGSAAFNTTNLGIFWGMPIVVYDTFLLASTGLVFIASLSLVFGLREFDPIVKRCVWLALAGLVGAVAVLFMELPHPIRALMLSPLNLQFQSPLFWKILLVAAYTILLLALILRLQTVTAMRQARVLAVPTLLVAIGIALVAGSVYGLMSMRPIWFGGDVPVVFLIESLVGGFAFTVFFTYLAYGFSTRHMPRDLQRLFGGDFGRLFAIVIGLHLLLHAGRAITGLWSNADGMQVWHHLVGQPLWHIGFWGGIVLPLLMMAAHGLRQSPVAQIAASILVLLGLFIARYEFIIGGQMVPLFKGSWAPDLLAYTPSITEWVLLLAGIFVANAVNAFGEWQLSLEDETPLIEEPLAQPAE